MKVPTPQNAQSAPAPKSVESTPEVPVDSLSAYRQKRAADKEARLKAKKAQAEEAERKKRAAMTPEER